MIDWTPILWVGGGFGTVIVILLGVIAYFVRSDREQSKIAWTKHDEELQKQHDEIREIQILMRTEQEHSKKRMDEIHEVVKYLSRK